MNLENRYLVLKRSDLDKLDLGIKQFLSAIVDKIGAIRNIAHKEPLEGIFIEKDWLEYDQVLKMLSDRVDKEDNPTIDCERCQRQNTGYCMECPDNPTATSSFIPISDNVSRKERKHSRKMAKFSDADAWLKRIKP